MSDIERPTTTPAGWHPDPFGRFSQRHWDGAAWTSHVADVGGVPSVDPAGAAPTVPTTVFPPQPQWQHPQMQTPSFNMPGGGAWSAPQQIVVANASKSPGLAVASLVLGIGSFFFALIPVVGLTSIPFAICGLALGIAGFVRATKGFEGKGLSIAGICGSIAALVVSLVYVAAIGHAVDKSNHVNTDPRDGYCNQTRYYQDPDC